MAEHEEWVGEWQLAELDALGVPYVVVNGGHVLLRGRLLRVVGRAEAETVDHIECQEWRARADDGTGPCAAGCGRVVYWRRTAPQRPPKLCVPCARARRGERDDG